MSLSEELTEKLAYKMVDIIPGPARFEVPQSCVTTWGIMLVLVLLSIFMTRKLEIVPKGKQALLEAGMSKLYNIFYDILGERGKQYIPYLLTVILYLAFANIMGLFGIAPPTKDLNVAAGLAIMSIIVVEYAGIRYRGLKGWAKSFAHPMALIAPMNILEIGIRPLSLCMRLFGNVLGAYIIMELIIYCVPAVVPLVASAYFDIFDGLLQAFVFCFLTSMFIQESIADEE